MVRRPLPIPTSRSGKRRPDTDRVTPTVGAAPYGCDMSGWVRLAGVPTVIYGPGEIELAHAPNEWVSLDTTYKVARTLVRTTERLLELEPESLRPPRIAGAH